MACGVGRVQSKALKRQSNEGVVSWRRVEKRWRGRPGCASQLEAEAAVTDGERGRCVRECASKGKPGAIGLTAAEADNVRAGWGLLWCLRRLSG
jgi:hypothetical protein